MAEAGIARFFDYRRDLDFPDYDRKGFVFHGFHGLLVYDEPVVECGNGYWQNRYFPDFPVRVGPHGDEAVRKQPFAVDKPSSGVMAGLFVRERVRVPLASVSPYYLPDYARKGFRNSRCRYFPPVQETVYRLFPFGLFELRLFFRRHAVFPSGDQNRLNKAGIPPFGFRERKRYFSNAVFFFEMRQSFGNEGRYERGRPFEIVAGHGSGPFRPKDFRPLSGSDASVVFERFGKPYRNGRKRNPSCVKFGKKTDVMRKSFLLVGIDDLDGEGFTVPFSEVRIEPVPYARRRKRRNVGPYGVDDAFGN